MRVCSNHTCGKDISHKRADAKFCSRSCKDVESSRRNYEQKEARRKEWRKENPDRVASYKKKTKAAFGTAYAAKRRVAKKSQTANLQATKGLYQICRRLNDLTGSDLHVDHIEPLTHPDICGLHSANNLQLLQSKLNLRKSNRRDYKSPMEKLLSYDPTETDNG